MGGSTTRPGGRRARDGRVDEARRRAARAVGPSLADRSELLGVGTDHVVFAAGPDLVVRVRTDVDADTASDLEREAELLAAVARVSPVAVPELTATWPDLGVAMVRRVTGTSLLERPPADPTALVDPLAGVLAALWSLPIERIGGLVERDDTPLARFLDEAGEVFPRVHALLGAPDRRRIEAFLSDPPPPPPPPSSMWRFIHGDLGAEHILAADDGTLTGIIDWSDAAIGDPARDLGRVDRDLGSDVAGRIAAMVPLGDDRLLERATFHARCALLEDLAYGIETGDDRYVAAALGSVRHTFLQ